MSFNMTSLQRRDGGERRPRASAIPIVFEFRAMQRRPLHDHTQNPMRQIPNQHRGSTDFQYSPMVAVAHVEVRRGVVVIVHRYDDTEESADFGNRKEPGAPGCAGCHRKIAWWGLSVGHGDGACPHPVRLLLSRRCEGPAFREGRPQAAPSTNAAMR